MFYFFLYLTMVYKTDELEMVNYPVPELSLEMFHRESFLNGPL